MNTLIRIRSGVATAILLAGAFGLAQDSSTGLHAGQPALDTVAGAAGATLPQYATSKFILGVADTLHISVWKNVELTQTVLVGPDGFVSLPLLGDIHVAGMTAAELARTLTDKYSNFIVQPQVTVSVLDIRSRQVYVLGQVGKPGGYPLIGPMNVLQLIAQAGGLGTYANRKAITVLRATQNGTQKITFNYSKVLHGEGKQNIQLEPGDTVIVP